jgi:NAD(P)-dependent dehydrogenase (short-subunit alcohol dehydrogenase family)
MDRIALVTGASSGIGQAIAIALARAGATVGLLARNLVALNETAEMAGPKAFAVACDLVDDAQLNSVRKQVIERTGRLDILVHSAAVYHQGAFESSPVEDLDQEYRVNLRAPYVLTQQFLPDLKQSRGQVVFINSSTGVQVRPMVSQYAAVKHALKALADVIRMEVGPAGVRVISVYPGKTATPMQERRHAIEGKAYRPEELIQPADVAAAVEGALTMQRTAEMTDSQITPKVQLTA